MALHWRKRSDAVVFVDDYVTGALPPLCVLSGTPANATITFRSSVNATSPAAWLLVLLGPLGWVVLAYLVLRSDRRRLVGELPIVRTQWEHLRSVKHAGWALAGAALALFVLASALPNGGPTVVFIVPGVAALVAALAIYVWLPFQWPTISLDASGRWVTLAGVHPDFARSVARTRTAQRDDSSRVT